MNRRTFTKWMLLGISQLVEACGAASTERTAARPPLLELLDAERVREIGEQYRAQVAAEDDRDILRRLIAGPEPRRTPIWRQPSWTSRSRQEYAQRQVVILHGWVLSLTEARQCALFTLVAPLGRGE